MNIKVCGITQFKQLQQLDGLNIDYAGLNFVKDSIRFVGDLLDKDAVKNADFDLKKVGIFNNPDLIDVIDAIDDYGLDVVQLQGNESTELCDDLSSQAEVIKAFVIDKTVTDIDALVADYDGVCDYYLFEAKNEDELFDWEILRKAKIEKPFFISGGISVDDIAKIKKFKHLDFLGVNINSHFEKEPGVKDMAKLLAFVQGMK
ncbi:MAG: phosphoribosylanthranilate isomerase [Ferruginibacter sp.]|nr:phosphoribosylanthranilate isomerase [Ferruginibacter sp.]